ncbi:MAG: 30S ribosomal protein S26e [Nanoarchaeota archaeon]|nr:30S ribosomal protein S26e [Nanoarchaeota archaeon]MBU1135122.1 30S ribosomal protein S26e [Nanoarchaeota archaeon]MBU2520132.1 30S ribosomal protein S26e [Nanoarchaeota archaeon]
MSFYKRGWHHTKTRGKEGTITCSFCGRKVPKYKTFPVTRGFSINDPVLKKELGSRARYGINLSQSTSYACPGCARHRKIVRKKR